MGCGCAGSNRAAVDPDRLENPARRNGGDRHLAEPPHIRPGGPGEPGYYWTGETTVAEVPAGAPTIHPEPETDAAAD